MQLTLWFVYSRCTRNLIEGKDFKQYIEEWKRAIPVCRQFKVAQAVLVKPIKLVKPMGLVLVLQIEKNFCSSSLFLKCCSGLVWLMLFLLSLVTITDKERDFITKFLAQ